MTSISSSCHFDSPIISNLKTKSLCLQMESWLLNDVEYCWMLLRSRRGPNTFSLYEWWTAVRIVWVKAVFSTSQKLLSEKAERSVRQYIAFIYQICHQISVRNIVWTFDQLDGCFSEAFWCLILSSPTSLVQSPTLLLLQPSLHRCGPICLVALLLDKALHMSQVTPNRGSEQIRRCIKTHQDAWLWHFLEQW